MAAEQGSAATPPPVWRRYALALWVLLLVAIGAMRALNRYLVGVAYSHVAPFAPLLIEELTGSLSFGAFLPPVFYALRWLRPRRWRLLWHAAVFASLSVAQASLMIGLRLLVFGWAGLPADDYAPTPWRYVMEMPTQLFFYVLIAVGL